MVLYISINNSHCWTLPVIRQFAGLSVASLFFPFFLFSNVTFAEEVELKPAAVVWYEELAAKGDVDAKFNLGMMNETGWSVPVNLPDAVHWYRDAAKSGHAESQLRLGMLYYLGLGSRQSKLKGEGWIRKAANQGHKFAAALNSQLFITDVSENVDTVKVLGDIRDVYLKNEKDALPAVKRLINLARKKSESQKQEKEESTIKERREVRIANQPVVDTKSKKTASPQSSVGTTKTKRIENKIPEFAEKVTAEENRILARGNIDTIRLQAKKGQASAQFNLGRMNELGIKIPVDKKVALDWYQKAAAQGYPDAEYRLAIAFLYGVNVEKDETLGRQWLDSAARHGHQVAKNLMEKLTKNEGVLRSGQSAAVDWYLERAIVGDAEAALRLGKIYEFGWGAFLDTKEASKWYQKAVMLGSTDARESLDKLNKKITSGGSGNTSGMIGHSALPSNWIAYVIAIAVAAFFFFSPVLMKRQRQRMEIENMDIALIHRKDLPFTEGQEKTTDS